MQKIYIWASVILHHRTHAATSFLVLTITSFFENSEPLKAYIELRICQLKCSIHCSIISPWFYVRWKTLNSKFLVSFFWWDENYSYHLFLWYQWEFLYVLRIEQNTISETWNNMVRWKLHGELSKFPFSKKVISSLKRMSKFMYFSNATENFVLHGSR